MASFYLTDTLSVNWAAVSWANLTQYKYRRTSTAGKPLAQTEFDRRQQQGIPTVMWRFDTNNSPPRLIASFPAAQNRVEGEHQNRR